MNELEKQSQSLKYEDIPIPAEAIIRLENKLEQIGNDIFGIKSNIETRLNYDRTKEEAFEHLYDELKNLKGDASFDNLKPLYLDLILLFDRIDTISESISNQTKNLSANEINFGEILQTLREEVLEILYRRGIETLSKKNEPKFNPEYQRAIGTEATNIESENNQVVSVIRQGFKYEKRLLRAEEVIVQKFVPISG